MKSLLQDARYGWRAMLRSPGFTTAAVVTLALGIGANTTIFSWINSTLLHPLPGVSRTANLVSVTRGGKSFSDYAFSYPDFKDLREGTRSFSSLTAFSTQTVNLTGIARPQRAWVTLATANYFDLLGVQPVLGRGFLPAEDQKPGGAPVAVISYGLWQTLFGSDDSVIGRTININQHPYQIVGVAPPLFQGSQTGLRSDLWIPLMMEKQIVPATDLLPLRDVNWLLCMGRLKPGVSAQVGAQEMSLLLQQIVKQFPDAHRGSNIVALDPLWRSPLGANAYFYILLPILFGISGLVLLLACVNVANLLLVRSVTRRREIAIRLSMGASRWRLVRQLLVESMMLALAGGGLAMLLTTWTAGSFSQFLPSASDLHISLSVQVDRSVLLVALIVSMLTSVIFGILPALRASSLTPVSVLKEESGSSSGGRDKARLSSVLVVAQISLSLVLLVCAGLFIQSFANERRFDPGFKASNVLLATYELFPAGYSDPDGRQFHRQLIAKLGSLPGVESVSLATWLPLGFGWSPHTISPEGYVPQPHESMDIGSALVSPNYFKTIQIPLLAGRDFTPRDTEKSQLVAIVNQALVDRYWPHQDVIGKHIVVGNTTSFSVVGVVHTSNYTRLNEQPQPFVYLALYQDYFPSAVIHARVSGDPLAFSGQVEKAVHELNPDLPLFDQCTLQSRIQTASTLSRIAGTFVGGFGIVALILAAVGIYGVIAYITRQRTREIGIRMALGAQQTTVFWLVLGQGLRLTLIGLGLGVAMSLVLTRSLSRLLFGITPTDALTFAAVAVLLSLVAAVACYLPAQRATKVDPIVALRCQ